MNLPGKSQKLIKKAVSWARKRGFVKIKANIENENFETPASFVKPGEKKPYVPDVTGMKFGRKNYIEIALKTENVRRTISKWKLLSTLANMKNGKLFLLAPRGHKAFARTIVKERNLNAKVIGI